MATIFPTGLDNFTNPNPTDTMLAISHSTQHANVNDAIEAVQSRIGISGSSLTGTIDYKINQFEGETGNGTFRIFNGSAYFKYTGYWHQLVPVIDNGALTFEISYTGVLR